ncbi:flagellar biosynthetic protein FliR [Paracoccus sp. (in: a-proteobacteria)]|uniref:flagellar biosynthetic protein FliR n=1 Tax=Paracoccus sp. TaxID=267 RepID=UPI0026DF2637|nr:flagellar biosynthetic protein FliR [Paracoccus sp. (in: a-proteobacteria)]MDO5369709.1 flagellar biosynthetic protein FliR [Paracoccus sp. (in: a-proteobacteria)]
MTPELLLWLTPLLLVYARIQACLLAMPGIGERFLPIRVRVAAAMSLAPLYAGAARPMPPPLPLQLAALMAAEIVSGLVLGLMVRVVAMALDVASTTLAQSASMSALLGISDDMPPHPIGNLMHMAGLAVLMAMGLPVMICQVLTDSFAVKPPGLWPEIGALWPAFPGLIAHSFTLALLLASPFILGGLLFQLLSGVVARVMPAMPVVFVAAPAAILLALAALALLMPGLLSIWAGNVLSLELPDLR